MRKKNVLYVSIAAMDLLVIILAIGIISDNWKKHNVPETETELENKIKSEETIAAIQNVAAGTVVNVSEVPREELARLFYDTGITREVLARIDGVSYKDNISLDELRYARVLYMGTDGNNHVGELIVNQSIAKDIEDIMKELYWNQYPIGQMVLVDNYGGDDETSMSANNTSAFNCREITGGKQLSKHAFGLAIDVNPLYNPYCKMMTDGSVRCEPEAGRCYLDRSQNIPYKIDETDLCYQLFVERGFTWGGSWSGVKDYQHFEK